MNCTQKLQRKLTIFSKKFLMKFREIDSKKGCYQKLWTQNVKISCGEKLWKRIQTIFAWFLTKFVKQLWTKVVNKSHEQNLWTEVLNPICEKVVSLGEKQICDQKLSCEHKLWPKNVSKSCEQNLLTTVVKKSCK